MAEEQKSPNWTPGAIAVIGLIVFGFIAWAISEYRPTAFGQRTWEWIAGISLGGAVALFILAHLLIKRRKL